MYTSGSTGKPKGLIHSSAPYLLQALVFGYPIITFAALTTLSCSMVSFKYVFDFHEGDVFACTADVGWINGHSYLIYGPLAMGQL